MSYPADMKSRMAELLEQDAESWSRLSGMMAVLALPPTRHADGEYYRRAVEIEIAPKTWAIVDCVSIESDRFVFWQNGKSGQPIAPAYQFSRSEGAPAWRLR